MATKLAVAKVKGLKVDGEGGSPQRTGCLASTLAGWLCCLAGWLWLGMVCRMARTLRGGGGSWGHIVCVRRERRRGS